ncbi:DUF808 domain-containing protein [Xanthomonadaceae bacterium JHOS43]|nr:DUF808 domain-containing protein [Xanthomonadaceae bacterium JHOS43]
MAGASLLALIDDIATILDDVAVMTKVAAKKTAGVLGDDLALNAQQVTGVRASRELPVVWAVALGSLVNKAILVPAALAISTFAPWAVTPLMMAGGTFLCYEGVEKLLHGKGNGEKAAHDEALRDTLANPDADMRQFERDRIRGAIRTDFILSAEIIVITLGTVADAAFSRQLGVLVAIALVMTVGVYGLVAGIVKLDDAGLWLSQRASAAARASGRFLLALAPWLMKILSVAGMAAMFLVGGGILVHAIAPLHHAIEGWAAQAGGAGWLVSMLGSAVVGVLAGLAALLVVATVKRLRGTPTPAA